MKYIHGTTEFHIEEECVLSLGKFDGLHRGCLLYTSDAADD